MAEDNVTPEMETAVEEGAESAGEKLLEDVSLPSTEEAAQ